MGEFEIFLKVLVTIAAGVVTIGGAYAVIDRIMTKARAPHDELERQVSEHEDKLDNDHKRIGELEESNRLIMRGVMQLMSHEIDGNHRDQLQATRDEMEQYLINK